LDIDAMNFGFPADLESLQREFRKQLAGADRRAVLDAADPCAVADAGLWQRLASNGWLATSIPEDCGGSGLDPRALCLLAEEAGRQLVAVPFVASACGFVQALRLAATAPGADVARVASSQLWSGLADGSARGALLADDCWSQPLQLLECARGGIEVSGLARHVPDGPSATHAIALAGQGADCRLVILTLDAASRDAATAPPLDLLHPCCDLQFERRPAVVLARGDGARAAWDDALYAQALFVAFEQLGGAEAALEAARGYSLQRYAFGRAIGSFQALKHLMVDMLVAVDLARSNCYFGAAALAVGGEVLAEAAAVARISATDAFRACAIGSTQIHGAFGVTWEADCHLYYRRAQALAGSPGSLRSWKERLVQLLRQRAAVEASPRAA
jgi:alkylation response protein AidB-like acyl-CoA dehydrogenase